MRVARWLGAVCSILLVTMGVAAMPALGGDRGNERGVFVNAMWERRDRVTGAERFLVVEASGPTARSPGETFVSLYGFAFVAATCPDGEETFRMEETSGYGQGAVTVQPGLSGGTVVAALKIVTTVMDPCDGTTERHAQRGVPVRVALDPAGPIRHESGGYKELLPSLFLSHEHGQIRVRDGDGQMVVGDRSMRSTMGEFGRIHVVWQAHAPGMTSLATRMRSSTAIAAAVASATSHESVQLAGIAWDRETEQSLRVVEIDAARQADGTVTLSVSAFSQRAIRCDNGSMGAVFSMTFGESTGALSLGRRLGAARGSATINLASFRGNECTEQGREWMTRDVPVSFTLTAQGPVLRTTDRMSWVTPSVENAHIAIVIRQRAATGAFSVGERAYPTSTWGAIGQLRARLHGMEEPS